ncbi:hypothetical protein SUGI_0875810 [Cryptomeria japonica]|uniref:uncharacterized protein LOC131054853 n=1 Tax=Cryptomeria japonica TaxID=3369 RepID=UPI002414BD9E|nr:uncharacterized protein LOC131054853 [Cryptomeria japonica]GLJ42305.1 hypothetical protein SUGI_0875810 [Cryptomeria japonica]
MESLFKSIIVMLVSVALMAHMVMGEGECGNTSVEAAALKMAPCAEASQDPQASVSSKCCAAALDVASNPSCLCALIKLGESQKAFNPQAALTIPKRCNFQLKHSGYKCGSYTLP